MSILTGNSSSKSTNSAAAVFCRHTVFQRSVAHWRDAAANARLSREQRAGKRIDRGERRIDRRNIDSRA